MGIEKKAALICVVILAILFGIGLSNREHREVPEDKISDRSRAMARKILDNLGVGENIVSSEGGEGLAEDDAEEGIMSSNPAESPVAETGWALVKVQPGDNFSRIAHRILGKASLYPLIIRHNPGLDPRNLREGQTVRVPLTESANAANPNSVAVTAGDARGPRTYRVKPDETLSGIAQSQYGRASEWRKIFAANRNKLKRPESLRAGMVIKLP